MYERLDRALCNDNWRIQFSDAQVKVLTRVEFSDHHHVLVSLKDNARRDLVKTLKFECVRVLEETHGHMIKGLGMKVVVWFPT